jgi:hypothetical protein
MDINNSQVNGDVVVKKDTQFNNIHCDNIIVEENVMARFFGAINGNITLKNGSSAYLHGRLNGKVINEGGVLYLFHPNGQVESF